MNAPTTVLSLVEMVRDLGPLWVELGAQIQRRDSSQVSGKVVTSSGTETPAPGNVAVISARAAIEHFASGAMRELRDSRTWPPHRPMAPTHREQGTAYREALRRWRADATLPTSVPAVLVLVSRHVTHWTESTDDVAQGFKALVVDLHTAATKVAYPHERMLPIGVACYMVTCKGQLQIELPEPPVGEDGKPKEMTEAERKRHFRDTRPVAVCSVDSTHRVDAALAYHKQFRS